ncbi:CheR family methyltransferase [Lutispora thermophila]|uniref:protein-glutamate O-methyltransferase n=1 Tax=Lutispora thermophila DSM 19022 TaxID=1122184 RepID=A0A1M6D5E1_9FIRM|nr:protein-glutamate O-methyltransferase CheR [Lutispora thermophila]SHI68476.1 chemotaxis protein methyltransferase CheR [Lutispora thermophila DSM 19022]
MITITKNEFKRLAEYIENNYGIRLKEEKKSLVINRLYHELVNSNCKNFTEYYEYILSDKSGKAITTLINKITTNHTFFMREADHFQYFRDKVLPYLSTTVKDKDLRIWSAGCSSGQEPYTLAMIIDDYFKNDKIQWDTKILATDISSKVLNEAINGVYNKDEIESLPSLWRLNYFQKLDNGSYMIIDEIKQEVIYRKFNLMEKTFPFRKKLHVIFCRNVMIYFDHKTKIELVKKFYDIMEYGGYLFIGHTESIPRNETGFKYVMPSVYRKV